MICTCSISRAAVAYIAAMDPESLGPIRQRDEALPNCKSYDPGRCGELESLKDALEIVVKGA